MLAAHRTGEDRAIAEAPGELNLDWQLVLRCPALTARLKDLAELEELRQRCRASGDGRVQRELLAEAALGAEQRCELVLSGAPVLVAHSHVRGLVHPPSPERDAHERPQRCRVLRHASRTRRDAVLAVRQGVRSCLLWVAGRCLPLQLRHDMQAVQRGSERAPRHSRVLELRCSLALFGGPGFPTAVVLAGRLRPLERGLCIARAQRGKQPVELPSCRRIEGSLQRRTGVDANLLHELLRELFPGAQAA